MIRFKDVSLSLGNKQLLKNFNLRIGKGDKVLLAAQSGSGKTSLLRLILGFSDPDSGNIFFKKKAITSETIHQIRRQMAYLSQDVDFPNGKVREVFQEIFQFATNKHLAYSEEKLREKLAAFDLPETLLNKNNRYDDAKYRLVVAYCELGELENARKMLPTFRTSFEI